MVGVLVDAYDDASWDQLRIAEDGLLIVDSHGTIVHRGSAHQLSDNELMDKHNITNKSSQIVKLEVSLSMNLSIKNSPKWPNWVYFVGTMTEDPYPQSWF